MTMRSGFKPQSQHQGYTSSQTQEPTPRGKYFKSNTTFKNMNKLNERMEQKKKNDVEKRFSF